MTEGNAGIRLELEWRKKKDILRYVCMPSEVSAQNLWYPGQYSRVSCTAVWVARGDYPEEVMDEMGD